MNRMTRDDARRVYQHFHEQYYIWSDALCDVDDGMAGFMYTAG